MKNKTPTSAKMFLLAEGYSKEEIYWTDEDEKVLLSLIPDKEKLLKALNKRGKKHGEQK